MPISKNGRCYFREADYRAAQAASALEYALRRGYDLVPVGSRFVLREHDSMVFLRDGKWHWNSHGLHGRALEFAQQYEGLTLPEAVCAVTEDATLRLTPDDAPAPKLFVLPPVEAQNAQLYEYMRRRGIDWGILDELCCDGRIYMTTRQCGSIVYRNAVFVGFDADGAARSATLRGLAYGSSFKGEVPGSDKRFPFVMPGTADTETLAVYESAIDALSHATLARMCALDWRHMERIAQGGSTVPGMVSAYLAAHPKLKTVHLCFDNDAAGRVLAARLSDELRTVGVRIVPNAPPSGKDWNDYLLNYACPRTRR